jgi:hypothetical protein
MSPAPDGQPAGGSPLPQAQGRPDLQTILSSMTGEGQARSAVRTTREQVI